MKIIAIDIAYKKPLAVCMLTERGKPLHLFLVQPTGDIYSLSRTVLDLLVPLGPCLVITETPLIIHNMNTAFMMTRMHAMLEKGVRDSGSLFFGIHPATWQKAMLKPEKGDDRKKLSIAEASKWIGKQITSDDEADAVNLARYAYDHKKEILKAIGGGKKFNEK